MEEAEHIEQERRLAEEEQQQKAQKQQEEAEAEGRAPENPILALLKGLFSMLAGYLGGVSERVNQSREGQHSPGGLTDVVQKPPLFALTMVTDLLTGYEQHKPRAPGAPERPMEMIHVGMGKDAFVPNADALRQQQEAELLGNLPSPSTPNVAQSRSAQLGPNSGGRSIS